jgi:hypothetical protein
MKIRLAGAELFHADGQTDSCTDMVKLIVTSHNFGNAPKIRFLGQIESSPIVFPVSEGGFTIPGR